jgi:hypothetical protein
MVIDLPRLAAAFVWARRVVAMFGSGASAGRGQAAAQPAAVGSPGRSPARCANEKTPDRTVHKYPAVNPPYRPSWAVGGGSRYRVVSRDLCRRGRGGRGGALR